jgi:hypothetical protein
MILCTGDEIRRTDPHRRKYADAMSEYLDHLAGISGQDAESGDVQAPTGWFALFGRRILRHDNYGFVGTETYPDPMAAAAAYDLLDVEYAYWGDEGD